MWTPLLDDRFGLMKPFSGNIAQAASSHADLLPDLHAAPTILAASDYSGQHKRSAFGAYCFLFVTPEGWFAWENRRQQLRRHHRIERRRLSFKKLGDERKQRM